ncbi:MAG TPA: glycosyltransferase family 4 protein [Firmicutes bacterium]|nr:glycosyltransferase family 4 protein [Candidatus Fermentithermobacillaceae bacterium]
MSLNVLMLSWEYPPDHVGGLGRHVMHLSRALVERGSSVTVLTRTGPGKPDVWRDQGVTVVSAAPYSLSPPDFVTWAAEFNVSLLEESIRSFEPGRFDVIHAHDWIVAPAARALKHAWGLPLVATIHATECGRQRGLHTPMQRHISELEWWLCYEAWRVIGCSRYMKDEICGTFSVPDDKVRVIPNGIDEGWFSVQRNPSPDPLVIYVGRLVPEKGSHILVDAMSDVVMRFPTAKLVIAGGGPMEEELRRRVWDSGLRRVVELAGHLDDKRLKELYSRAWVACFPSSYEPFGIVALEAMATGAPCVVGDAGGLSEIVDHMSTGLKVRPNDPVSLAGAVCRLLEDGGLRDRLSSAARLVARTKYSWDDIAARTLEVYDEVTEREGRRAKRATLVPSYLKEDNLEVELSKVAGSEAGDGSTR